MDCEGPLDKCAGGKGADQAEGINFYPPKDQISGYGKIKIYKADVQYQKRAPGEALEHYLARVWSPWRFDKNELDVIPLHLHGHEALQVIVGERAYNHERVIRTFIPQTDNDLIILEFSDNRYPPDLTKNITSYKNVDVYNHILSSFKFIPYITMKMNSAEPTYAEMNGDWKTYKFSDYQIAIPKDFTYQSATYGYDSANFTKNTTLGKNSIMIIRSPAPKQDPCTIFTQKGAPNGFCTTINGYRAFDEATDKGPHPIVPTEYSYLFIQNDIMTTVVFSGIDADQKNQILHSLKFFDK